MQRLSIIFHLNEAFSEKTKEYKDRDRERKLEKRSICYNNHCFRCFLFLIGCLCARAVCNKAISIGIVRLEIERNGKRKNGTAKTKEREYSLRRRATAAAAAAAAQDIVDYWRGRFCNVICDYKQSAHR